MGQTLHLRLFKAKRATFLISLGSIFFRYAVLAVPLILAINFEQFDLPATILGIFMIQLIILADHLLNFINSREKRA